MEQLRDIKPLLEISDSSYYYYLVLLGVALLLGVVLLFFIIKTIWKNRKINQKKLDLEALKNIDWSDAKEAAYQVSFLAHKFMDDKKIEEIYLQTQPFLEQYKYKKEVEKVDKKTLQQYNLLVHVIDESL